jgi:cytochrome c peroxidase
MRTPMKSRRKFPCPGPFVRLSLASLLGFMVTHAATLQVALEARWDRAPLRLGEVTLTNAAGNVLSVTRLDCLLSEFALVSAVGDTVALTNQFAYVSVGAGRTRFALSNAPSGPFTALRFRVGLTPEANHRDPATVAPEHPLNPVVNGLHWGWQGGYVFLALEGNWRRDDGKTGGYSYHLATDAHVLPVELPLTRGLNPDRELILSLDVARIFSGPYNVRLGDATASSHSRTNDTLAGRLGENLVRAFCVEGGDAKSLSPAVATASDRVEVARDATPYRFTISAFFPRPALPKDNPLTEQGVELGRRLFNDPLLSVNGKQSCASCHQAEAAFAEAGKRFSAGAEGQFGTRNAMSLANLAWQNSFFWDGRAGSLREQVLQPIQNPNEMHESLTNVVAKLARADYAPLFFRAFGTAEITADRMARALEQFLLTRTAHTAKFDQVLLGREEFTAEERRGFELFHTEYDPRRGQFGADCFHCHGGPLFSDFAFHNNGLDAEDAAKDPGRFLVTTNRADRAKFKTPSLRNVAVTAPYMHDGRFATLAEAVAHYATGVRRSATLDPNLAKHPDGGVPLTAEDQRALVAFLGTLTDRGAGTNAGQLARTP